MSEPSRSMIGYIYAVSGDVGPLADMVRGESALTAFGRPCSAMLPTLSALKYVGSSCFTSCDTDHCMNNTPF
jgi:hypothetical protein